jgi:CDP-paratose 2-epimerase
MLGFDVHPARVGDPRYDVSDTRLFQQATGWRPRTQVDEGLAAVRAWMAGEAHVVPGQVGTLS